MIRFPSCLAALALAAPWLAASAQSFVCGGIGVDEQQRIKAQASGNCDGPIMLVDLPRGPYRVTATVAGTSRHANVTVARAKRPAMATFVWPGGPS